MSQQEDKATISKLQGKLKAQQKTIDVLMNAAEERISAGASPTELLAHNLNLERVVQQKTETLKRQGELLKQALQNLQLTQTRLLQAQKLESVGQLASGIAHEINTPMQYISTNIEFLEEASRGMSMITQSLQKIIATAPVGIAQELQSILEKADWEYLMEEVPAAITQSKNGITRVTSIVRAMKEFSHPSSKIKENVVVNKIIETTVLISRNEWKYVSRITTDLAIDLPPVPCHIDELGQVILNLVINAAHAIGEKLGRNPVGDKGEIHISTKLVDTFVEIRIRDTGSGIPVGIRERIFDPFFTTKEVGRGTGQGLTISHDVITKKHGGTLTFETEEGVGTTFIIHLPLLS
jgi:signal transduction histidine kinase